MEKNIISHSYNIDVDKRRKLSGHNSLLIFFTGLSGSGKSTVANVLASKLLEVQDRGVTFLDGDLALEFSFGDESGHNNRIAYQIQGNIQKSNIKLPLACNPPHQTSIR